MSKVLCKTEQDIIDSVYNVLLEESDCNDPNYTPAQVSCDDCLNQLGTLAQYQANYLASIGNPSNPPAAILTQIQTSYNNAKMRCTRVCTGISQQISAKRRSIDHGYDPIYRTVCDQCKPFSRSIANSRN